MSLEGLEKWRSSDPDVMRGIYPRLEHPYEGVAIPLIIFMAALGMCIGAVINVLK